MRNPRKHHSSVLLNYFLKGWKKKQEYSSRNSGTTSRSQENVNFKILADFLELYPHTQEKREKTGKGVPYSPKPAKMKIPTKKILKPGK
jgi:hypothetical protein